MSYQGVFTMRRGGTASQKHGWRKEEVVGQPARIEHAGRNTNSAAVLAKVYFRTKAFLFPWR